MVMDDLKYNTHGALTAQHEIFHTRWKTSSYDREAEETASMDEKYSTVRFIFLKKKKAFVNSVKNKSPDEK